MHHAALDRTGPHDGHLHHQIVETPRAQSRQHALLGSAFDLKHPHRVSGADHVVGFGALRWNVLHLKALALELADHVQATANGAEHAQRQHIDLHQSHGIQIILVPLDDAAIGHGRVLHRHQTRQATLGQHKSAHMLAQMPWETHQGAGQGQPMRHPPVVLASMGLEQRLNALRLHQTGIKPMVLPRKRIDQCLRNGQRLAHITQCALGPVADHSRRQGSALTTVLAVDVLNHLLPPLMLKIHINIRRLAA